jgi:hypothetical protein
MHVHRRLTNTIQYTKYILRKHTFCKSDDRNAFHENIKFWRWAGIENWRYFLEKSTNPENSVTTQMFDDGSEIMLLEVSTNQKFVADL